MKALYEDAPKLSDISEAFVQKYVEGIFDAGGDEDEQIFTLLPVAQKLADCEGSIDSIEVSALTTPDKEPARKAATKGPGALSPADYETWYCTAYVSSICYKWLDIGDYLVSRCTGRIVRTADTAFATFLYDTRKGKEGWNKGLLKMYKVNPDHMSEIIDCTDLVGGLTEKAAKELGLVEGIPVFGGGGDTTFVNIGAGCTTPGDTHIYVGTSGWVSTFMDHQTVDINAMITGVLSAKHGYFNYYAELETAGKCFEWVMEHLALDEIGVYLSNTTVADDIESQYCIYTAFNLTG